MFINFSEISAVENYRVWNVKHFKTKSAQTFAEMEYHGFPRSLLLGIKNPAITIHAKYHRKFRSFDT